MELDEQTYLILLQRYRELFEGREGGGEANDFDYPIDTYITETGTGTIDAEYINSKFVKFIKNLYMIAHEKCSSVKNRGFPRRIARKIHRCCGAARPERRAQARRAC